MNIPPEGGPPNKAVRVHSYGGPEVLVYEDVPRPEPAAELLAQSWATGGMVAGQPDAAQLDQFTAWIESGKLKPFVETVLPLTAVKKAQELSQSGRSRGKIVLLVS